MARHTIFFILSSIFLIFYTFPAFPENLNAHTSYKEITWEQLTPESWIAENTQDDFIQNSLLENKKSFDEALSAYANKWNDAPVNLELRGQSIKISGFVVPLNRDHNLALIDFLLVPYFGACIHVPPPPLNQIIYVQLASPQKDIKAMDQIAIYGVIDISEVADIPQKAAYSFYAEEIETYNNMSQHNFFVAICISLFTGLSILFGLLLALLVKNLYSKLFCITISFAAGIMTCISISILLTNLSWKTISGFFVGFISLALFGKLLHSNMKHCHFAQNFSGIKIMLPIAIHSIPEIFAIFSTSLVNPILGLILSGATIAHNIPLGISFALPNIRYRWRYAFLAGFIPVIIAILIYIFAKSLFTEISFSLLFPFIGGMMLFIALKELLPSASQLGNFSTMLCGYISGSLFILLILFSLSNFSISVQVS